MEVNFYSFRALLFRLPREARRTLTITFTSPSYFVEAIDIDDSVNHHTALMPRMEFIPGYAGCEDGPGHSFSHRPCHTTREQHARGSSTYSNYLDGPSFDRESSPESAVSASEDEQPAKRPRRDTPSSQIAGAPESRSPTRGKRKAQGDDFPDSAKRTKAPRTASTSNTKQAASQCIKGL
jgi:hypothetical protein